MPPLGSYFVVRTPGWVGWCIRIATRSQVNHAGVVVTGGIVEAWGKGARLRPFPAFEPGTVAYNDLEPLSEGQRLTIEAAALALVGTPYSYLDIVAIALGVVFWGRGDGPSRKPLPPPLLWFARRVESRHELICSQLVDRAYLAAGVHMWDDGRLSGQVTPGDLLLRLAQHPWKETP